MQNSWQRYRRALFVAALVMSGSVCAQKAVGQASQQNPPPVFGQPRSNTNDPLHGAEPPNPLAGSNASRLEHMREDERRKRLVADTAKLVELTNELKADVEKSSKDELSVEVVRKAAEIEKLAHDVKERMKY